MMWTKPATRRMLLFGLGLLLSFGALFQAQPSYAQCTWIQKFFQGCRSQGQAAGRKGGGAIRDRCPYVEPPLTAFVPSTPDGIPFVEKTTQDRPSFWFYIPDRLAADRQAEFALIDQNEAIVYKATFALTQPSELVRLELPATVPPMQTGKRYRWVLSILCNPTNRSGDATVNGWVERVSVSPALNNQLSKTSGIEKVFAYTDAELWYEMLASLAELQQANPQDQKVQELWTEALATIGLKPSDWKTYSLPAMSAKKHEKL